MADPSLNSSFIPKRGPAKLRRKSSPRKVYAFTIVSYVLIFAALLASAGVYIYEGVVQKQLAEEIANLNTEIQIFSEADMQQVLDFDGRLQQASGRVDKSVSMTSVFRALEAATIGSVQIEQLAMQRIGDQNYILDAAILTDSFDSTIFQRGEYQRNQVVEGIDIADVLAAADAEAVGPNVPAVAEGDSPLVSFKASLYIPVEAIPYRPSQVAAPAAPITITAPELPADESTDTEAAASNENDI
ncbi:hypothetical protein KC906_01290 [Candidatus Kaiserbacteria bacterium]|nr:hypothetical protein [Candidatus Kaiserbacteria bacterium]MCB9812176.1 hypothetical protein [Candidatus Nomurabacteria bacterium]